MNFIEGVMLALLIIDIAPFVLTLLIFMFDTYRDWTGE